LTPEQVAICLQETGIGFMFAPNHHAAMKHAAPVRKELGVRTIFNILGPLTNPAGAPNQLLGVFHPDLVGIQVRVLQRLGSEHVMVVYGMNGMDEVSLGRDAGRASSRTARCASTTVHPSDFGLPVYDSRAVLRWPTRPSRCSASSARWPTRTARCATSCCSTPARRCTRQRGLERGRRRAPRARGGGLGRGRWRGCSRFVAVSNRFRPAG
jgi:anthranilate phosphoribosyltransferase